MTVIETHKDAEAKTLTIDAAFDAPVERVWQLLEDPRLLERWWGPPTYPATFTTHDVTVGGRSAYFMTGPEGDRHHGWWETTAVTPPHELTFRDGFADESGAPNDDMPVTTTSIRLDDRPEGGTTMTAVTTFASVADMERLVAMGMEEGIRAAMGQMDDILAATATA